MICELTREETLLLPYVTHIARSGTVIYVTKLIMPRGKQTSYTVVTHRIYNNNG